jgi:hypothetical protein
METNFVSKQVGKPDNGLKKQIITAYSNLIERACDLEVEIERCLQNYAGFGINFFIEATGNNLETFIKSKYIKLNKIKIPGISNDRLIESNLLDIDGLEEAVKARKEFDQAFAAAKATRFIYPLQKLYIDETTGWELSTDFYSEVEKAVCQFTQNEQQNAILDKMNQFCNVLNELAGLNVIRSHHGKFEVNNLVNLIDCDTTNPDHPFSVNRFMFKKSRLLNIQEPTILV